MMLILSAYNWFKSVGNSLIKSDRGAAAVEYGLLVGLIAVAIILAVYWLGQSTHGVFCDVVSKLPFAGTQDCDAPMP